VAQSQVNLYNLALSACGHDYTVAAVDEQSIAAETCELWYENVRQVMLRTAFWSSTKRSLRLTLEAERDNNVDWVAADPLPGYSYSFDWPSNMMAARYLSTFGQFELGYDNDGRTINTNEEEPILIYSVDVTDPTAWEPDLYQAMIYAMAAHITMPLTGKVARRQSNLQLALDLIMSARANNANEINRLFHYQSTSLRLRGYSSGPEIPYIAPYGPWYALTSSPTT